MPSLSTPVLQARSRQRDGFADGLDHRRRGRLSEGLRRDLQSYAEYGGADAGRPARRAGHAEHQRPDQLWLRQPHQWLKDHQPGHLHLDQGVEQRQPDDECRHLHHRGRRLQRVKQCQRLRLGSDDLQRRQQLPVHGRKLRQHRLEQHGHLQTERTEQWNVCRDLDIPVAR